MKFILQLLFFLGCLLKSYAQLPQLTNKASISVMTCAGDPSVLYYAFGHTAIRVQDPVLKIDIIYNYGTFDFNQPNFYANFAKGRLLYMLTRKRYKDFLLEYELGKRWVKQQTLNLTQVETQELFRFLEWNALPENREYLYDPIYENCSTVVFQILRQQFDSDLSINALPKAKAASFRDLIHRHLVYNSWGSIGINLAWGAVVDVPTTAQQRTFLPYQAMYSLRAATKQGKPLVKKEEYVLKYTEKNLSTSWVSSPFAILLLLLIAVLAFTILELKQGKRFSKVDFTLFLITGLAGILLAFLWWGTDHVYTKNNANLLWLLPTHALVAFAFLKSNLPKWLGFYCLIALFLLVITLVIWFLKIQIFSPLIGLLLAMLAIRYLLIIMHSFKIKDLKTTTPS